MATIEGSRISVQNLTYGYGTGDTILNKLGCNIPAKKFTVILGKNGSGKSTLLRILGGIIPYSSGRVKVYEKELKEIKLKDRARLIGFLPQHHKAVFPFKVNDVIMTGRASYVNLSPTEKDQYEVDKAIEMIGISFLKNRIYTELSGGEQQLVMIARLLAQKPKILLLDEPVSHLDYNNQLRVIKLIKELVEHGIAVVAVLHDPNMAYMFGDNFIYVHENRAFEIAQQDIREHRLIKDVFHDNLLTIEHKGKFLIIPQL